MTLLYVLGFIAITILFSNVLADLNNIEGFEAGVYPTSVDKPLLYDSFPEAKHPGLSNLGLQQQYKNYPVFPADSTKNNNIRYWRSPNNGTCSPITFCGGLYDKKTLKAHPFPPVPTGGEGDRVNYYDSSSFCS